MVFRGWGGEGEPDAKQIFMEETNMKKIIATVLAMVMALALCSTAFAATGDVTAKSIRSTSDSKAVWFNTAGTSASSTDLKNITLTYHKAVAVKTNSNGEATNIGTACVAYYTVEVDGIVGYPSSAGTLTEKKLVAVSTLAAADYVVYYDAEYNGTEALEDSKDAIKNESGVVLYLAELDPVYKGVGTKFTNVGTKCGQVDLDTDETYYTSNKKDNDCIYKLLDEYTSATETMLVNGNLVPVEYTNKDTDDTVAHKATPTVKDGKVTGYTCSECKLAAIEAANFKSIPSDAQQITGNWYFPAVAASTTPTDGKTSPKTFDAGVAMYVGMALASVTGSAVVIGKKKEF